VRSENPVKEYNTIEDLYTHPQRGMCTLEELREHVEEVAKGCSSTYVYQGVQSEDSWTRAYFQVVTVVKRRQLAEQAMKAWKAKTGR
jgi:hypothetical protein